MLLFPKPEKREKKKKRINPRGEKVEAWEEVRKSLIPRFQAAGITACELAYPGCFRNNFLSFAHSKKRRYINGQRELEEVVLACQKCHNNVEYSGKENMYQTVRRVIASRKVQP